MGDLFRASVPADVKKTGARVFFEVDAPDSVAKLKLLFMQAKVSNPARLDHLKQFALPGVATESQFVRTQDGLIYPTFSRQLPAGSVCASQDDDIHQMSNLQSGLDLVTLHIYSPPLLVMGTHSLTERAVAEFHDPIFEFALGGGI